MERSHSALSGHSQQDDSWTCQRCGWVYPNAHPSAKHRRNHKKHCGKIKGFQLQSETHKGGSSDDASSDDGSHVNKESFPLQSAQTRHDIISPAESATVSVLQSRELPLPETNVFIIKQSDTPVLDGISAPIDLKPEIPAYDFKQDVDLTDVVKPESYAAAHVPDFGPFHKTSKVLGDEMDVNTRDSTSESAIPSNILEGNNVGVLSRAERVDAFVEDSAGLGSNQIGGALEKDFMLDVAAPELPGQAACLSEPSKDIEEKGRMNALPQMDEVEKAAQEYQVLHADQSREAQQNTTSTDHSIKRQGSSQEADSWTCRHCGWVYPNPHPSAKHRRNHKKHCGKLKGSEVQTEPPKGGSSDEVSSDEEKKELIQHDSQQDTSQITPVQNQASGSITGTTKSAEDPSRDLFTIKGDSFAGELPDPPELRSVTTSDESSYVDTAFSSAQEDFYREGEKGAAALEHSTLVPCDSDGLGIPQSKDQISSSEAIGLERHLKAVPFLVSSENDYVPVKDISDNSVSTSKVSGTSHKISGDSTSNVENSSVLIVPPSHSSQPADVGSSKDETGAVVTPTSRPKAEGEELGVVFTSISHPKVSGCANESLDALGGTGLIEQKGDESAEPDLVKPHSSAGEVSNRKFFCDKAPLPAAGSALNGEAENLPVEGSSVTNVLPGVALLPPDITGSRNVVEIENKFVSVQTTPNAGEGSPLKEDVSPIVALPVADVTDSPNDLENKEQFESVQSPLNPAELQTKDEISSEISGGLKDSSLSYIDKVVENPQMTQLPAQFSDDQATSTEDSLLEKRSCPADSSYVNDTPSSISLLVETKVNPEGASLMSPEDTFAASTKDGVLVHIAGHFDGPLSEMPSALSKNVDVGFSSVDNDSPVVSATAFSFETGTLSEVGDTLGTSTDIDMAPSSPPQESEHLSLVKDGHKDQTAEVSRPPEILGKPGIKDNTVYEADCGSSGRSLNGTNSFTKAESEFSQCSSSQLLFDSLEIYEDAPDTLEACSVGGSVESESLDEPRQVADGVQEDSKPSKDAPSDERVAGRSNELGQKPDNMNELEHMPIVMNGASTGEGIGEDKAATLPAGGTYAVRSDMEKLKAPSPEAWQEPAGPSTSKKEGKKMSTSEVMEAGKSSGSHTALRSLMAKEGQDKMDEAVASPSDTVDAKNLGEKEASENGKKSKSRLRSFWSQCVCCPAVH